MCTYILILNKLEGITFFFLEKELEALHKTIEGPIFRIGYACKFYFIFIFLVVTQWRDFVLIAHGWEYWRPNFEVIKRYNFRF